MSKNEKFLVAIVFVVVLVIGLTYTVQESSYMDGVCGWFGYSDHILINRNEKGLEDNDFLCYRDDGKSLFVALSNGQ